MSSQINLLFPEWQSYGLDLRPYHGAIKLAEELFGQDSCVCIDVPLEENLSVQKNVKGLETIVSLQKKCFASLTRSRPSSIFTVGGTCGAEIAPVSYLNNLYGGDLAVIWFDAHGDLNTPASSPSKCFHGMALRTLLGDGPSEITSQIELTLRPEQVFLVGCRDLDPAETQYIRSQRIHLMSDFSVSQFERLQAALKQRGASNLYLHLDLDVLDPCLFPNSLMPVKQGFSPDDVLTMVAAFNSIHRVVGFSLLEYCAQSESNIHPFCRRLLRCLVRDF